LDDAHLGCYFFVHIFYVMSASASKGRL
jgi:hypothetical protein